MFASPWKDGLIVLIIVLLFFGPKRLPALSRSIGESIREFKGGIAPGSDASEKSELASTSTETATTPAAPMAEARESSATSGQTNA